MTLLEAAKEMLEHLDADYANEGPFDEDNEDRWYQERAAIEQGEMIEELARAIAECKECSGGACLKCTENAALLAQTILGGGK